MAPGVSRLAAVTVLLLCVITACGALSRLREHYAWSTLDFTFPSPEHRAEAIASGRYVPENVLPMGIAAGRDRLVLTLPHWKPGVPATLATVPRHPEPSENLQTRETAYPESPGHRAPRAGPSEVAAPLLTPYPDWSWHQHQPGSCEGMLSVYRVYLDSCNRLWVLDSGAEDDGSGTNFVCPPQLLVFDFSSDVLLLRYTLPSQFVKQNSFFANLVVEVMDECSDSYAYLADIWRFGLVVYSLRTNTSRRIEHEYFYPDPLASRYSINGLTFRWIDGIMGLALSPPIHFHTERILYFHPMASFHEFAVPTSVLRNSSATQEDTADLFHVFPVRGAKNAHSAGSDMSRDGVLFYTLVSGHAVGCWNARLPFKLENLAIIDEDETALRFPSDLRVDAEQNVWVVSNRVHQFTYTGLNSTELNFRVLTGGVEELVRGTVCDPRAGGGTPAHYKPQGSSVVTNYKPQGSSLMSRTADYKPQGSNVISRSHVRAAVGRGGWEMMHHINHYTG